MDIKEMKSVLLAKGLRVADDDPIFSVAVLAEMAVNDSNAKHLQQLNTSLFPLEKFHVEMRSMGDAVLSALEILTIGRQFLSGENEQVLEEVSAIKGSIETIAQKISIRTIPDEDRLNKAIEKMIASLSHTVNSINGPRSILHLQNEAFLMGRIKEITAAVEQLKDIEKLLQSAARDRIDLLVAPVVQHMHDQVKRLSEKDTYAMRFMQKTQATHEKMAANIEIICAGVGLLGLVTLMAGFFLGRALAG